VISDWVVVSTSTPITLKRARYFRWVFIISLLVIYGSLEIVLETQGALAVASHVNWSIARLDLFSSKRRLVIWRDNVGDIFTWADPFPRIHLVGGLSTASGRRSLSSLSWIRQWFHVMYWLHKLRECNWQNFTVIADTALCLPVGMWTFRIVHPWSPFVLHCVLLLNKCLLRTLMFYLLICKNIVDLCFIILNI